MARKEQGGINFGDHNEWQELLEPYGWASVAFRYPYGIPKANLPVFEAEVNIMLNEDPSTHHLDEWTRRLTLVSQAQKVVELIRGKGYHIPRAPRIEFGGDYMFRIGVTDPTWVSDVRLTFEVVNNLR